jgi:hypothetical protein
MPAFPIPVNILSGNVLQFIARFFYRGQLAENVYWYQVMDGNTPEDAFTNLNHWMNQAQSLYAPLLTNGALFCDATLRVYTSAMVPITPTLFTQALNLPGTGGTSPMPTQVAGIITRRVLLTKNTNRGRVYIPFPDKTASLATETPSGVYLTNLNLLKLALMPIIAPFQSDGMQPWAPGLGSITKGDFNGLVDCQTRAKWATQRRRGDYGTPNVSPS